ncbi:hypothetical protein HGB07_10175 [Candidatus Roizmanbacteria bacterium]|nr:hypothetical protein [Candidatus Roizmanbacteria bacterium]
MNSITETEIALRKLFNQVDEQSAEELANLLENLRRHVIPREIAEHHISSEAELRSLLIKLAGQSISTTKSVISINDNGQSGDISIGDVAGGDIIKLSFSSQPENKTSIDIPSGCIGTKFESRPISWETEFEKIGRGRRYTLMIKARVTFRSDTFNRSPYLKVLHSTSLVEVKGGNLTYKEIYTKKDHVLLVAAIGFSQVPDMPIELKFETGFHQWNIVTPSLNWIEDFGDRWYTRQGCDVQLPDPNMVLLTNARMTSIIEDQSNWRKFFKPENERKTSWMEIIMENPLPTTATVNAIHFTAIHYYNRRITVPCSASDDSRKWQKVQLQWDSVIEKRSRQNQNRTVINNIRVPISQSFSYDEEAYFLDFIIPVQIDLFSKERMRFSLDITEKTEANWKDPVPHSKIKPPKFLSEWEHLNVSLKSTDIVFPEWLIVEK